MVFCESVNLYFLGPTEPVLPQRIYHLEHESLPRIDIFIVVAAMDYQRSPQRSLRWRCAYAWTLGHGNRLSNREIGERLLLSHRTAGSHLYRVFPKLGIASRAQLRSALNSSTAVGLLET